MIVVEVVKDIEELERKLLGTSGGIEHSGECVEVKRSCL